MGCSAAIIEEVVDVPKEKCLHLVPFHQSQKPFPLSKADIVVAVRFVRFQQVRRIAGSQEQP